MRYPGGKNCAGTYQAIINQIPPHRWYLEPFAGSAAVLRMKRPAEQSIAMDLDPGAIAALAGVVPPSTKLLVGAGLAYLADEFSGSTWEPETFVYCDPPYLPSAIASRLRYRCKLTEDDHRRLLDVLVRLRCDCMISGYWSPLYAEKLAGWRTVKFPQITRGGYSIDEWLWMNYSEPVELHDYRYLGANYRERENLKRQRMRWERKLRGMTILQRRALVLAMHQVGQEATAAIPMRPSPPRPTVAAAVAPGARVLHRRNGRGSISGKASGARSRADNAASADESSLRKK